MITINIALEFTKTPGARYKSDGPYSGEEFRERFLEKHFDDATDVDTITVVLDGTAGYGTSFLEEAFGGLCRKYSKEQVKKRLNFVSNEEPILIDEITEYIENADEKR